MIINIIAANGAKEFPTDGINYGISYSFEVMQAKGVKVDKIFMMDGIDGMSAIRNGEIERDYLIERINFGGFDLVTPFYEKGVEKSEVYPLSRIKERYDILYFKSTIAFMLAYAALQNPTEVHLYGINQAGHIEYLWERPAVEYWIGVLIGQGVKVISHDKDSRLFGGRPVFGGRVLYGYECKEKKALRLSKKNENISKK